MPVDNDLYNRPGDIWWDESQPLSTLLTMANPLRFGYFRRILLERLRLDPLGRPALDVGCGGGFLAEEFARLGCAVTGIDPSEPSLTTARAHAARSGLAIDYRSGAGEHLPFDDQSFDIVYCCDVLEHVASVDAVIAEIARVLRPGGVFFYDTINRTLLSKILVIKLGQEWPLTRLTPPNLHDYRMFVKPAELAATLARHGLANQEFAGLKPAGNPLPVLRSLVARQRGALSYGELGRRIAARLRLVPGRYLATSYAGYALKPP